MNKPIVFSNFSGGRTSAFMSIKLKENYSDKYDLRYIFANTGEEREETLVFVDKVSKEYGLDTVWVEASIPELKGKGTSFKLVDFETASRKGEPYEALVKKFGVPNIKAPICTKELKRVPILKYIKSLGIEKHQRQLAIGIREDEIWRCLPVLDAIKERIIYPLVELFPTDKQDVLDFWKEQPFDLGLEEHQGNCKWCFKKSTNKLFMVMADNPEYFDFPEKLERLYTGRNNTEAERRKIFRGNLSTVQLKKLFEETRERVIEIKQVDAHDKCGDSCEPF